MSGPNVVRLDPNPPPRRLFSRIGVVTMLVFVIGEAMMFAGVLGAFLVTRATAGVVWPPAGQPWFSVGETAINSAALLASGALVLRAARVWRDPRSRIGPLLLAAIALGGFFLFFQGLQWASLIRRDLAPVSSLHGKFFCIAVGLHAANTVAALIFLTVAWLRLKPLRDDGTPRGSLSHSTFLAARIFWYFVVGAWPVIYLFQHL